MRRNPAGVTALVSDTPRVPRSDIEVIRRLLSLSNRLPSAILSGTRIWRLGSPALRLRYVFKSGRMPALGKA
jgi:hypothetical protein